MSASTPSILHPADHTYANLASLGRILQASNFRNPKISVQTTRAKTPLLAQLSWRISTMHRNDLRRCVKKAHRSAVTRAKIKGHFRIYDLRHTFATRAVAAGADLPTLSSLLGHTSILMTMRYVHPAAEQKRVAMGKFETFSAEGIINAAIAEKNHGVPTEVTTMGMVN